jgi:hypothetical protein
MRKSCPRARRRTGRLAPRVPGGRSTRTTEPSDGKHGAGEEEHSCPVKEVSLHSVTAGVPSTERAPHAPEADAHSQTLIADDA